MDTLYVKTQQNEYPIYIKDSFKELNEAFEKQDFQKRKLV